MRMIKTVIEPIERAQRFDEKINAMVSDGWTVSKRELLNAPGMLSEAFNMPVVQYLYAELERWEPIPFEEVTV